MEGIAAGNGCVLANQYLKGRNDMKTYIGTRIASRGYEVLTKLDRKLNPIRFHVVLAERALGKPLPKFAVVHHHNGNKTDNRPANLVICPNQKYHLMLHIRMEEKKACGHVNWRKCWVCKKYDSPENIFIPKRSGPYHRSCELRWSSLHRARITGGRSKYKDE